MSFSLIEPISDVDKKQALEHKAHVDMYEAKDEGYREWKREQEEKEKKDYPLVMYHVDMPYIRHFNHLASVNLTARIPEVGTEERKIVDGVLPKAITYYLHSLKDTSIPLLTEDGVLNPRLPWTQQIFDRNCGVILNSLIPDLSNTIWYRIGIMLKKEHN